MLNRFNRCFSTVKKTCLHDLMLSHKGKIVDFAGIFTLNIRIFTASSIQSRHNKITSSLSSIRLNLRR